MGAANTLLHVIDTGGPGGAETIFLNLVTGLKGWRSIAVVPVKDWLWYALKDHGIEPALVPSAGSFDIAYLKRLRKLVREHRPALIQTHLFGSAVYATTAAMGTGVPVVNTFHGRNDVPLSESYRRTKLRVLARRRNRYVFVSEDLRRWYCDRDELDGKRARVVHNGIDCDAFHPSSAPEVRRSLGGGEGDILIGAVGNLRQPKDYPNFLQAAAILARRSERFRFVIVGAMDEPLNTELRHLARALGLGDRLMLPGFRNDVAAVMNALDVYVLSSSAEGFSLTTVQAMACGVPVAATRCGGPEEIIDDGVTGLLVPPRAPQQLAEAIDRIVTSATLQHELRKNGRRRAVNDFSLVSMVNAYEALYQECLASHTQARFAASTTAPQL